MWSRAAVPGLINPLEPLVSSVDLKPPRARDHAQHSSVKGRSMNRAIVVGLSLLLCGSTKQAQIQKSLNDAGGQAVMSAAGEDIDGVQGTWTPVEAILAGQPMPEAVVKSIRLRLEEGTYEVFVGDTPDRGTYMLDVTAAGTKLYLLTYLRNGS